jgi:hypothetical protein
MCNREHPVKGRLPGFRCRDQRGQRAHPPFDSQPVGAGVPDDNEFILIDLPKPLDLAE